MTGSPQRPGDAEYIPLLEHALPLVARAEEYALVDARRLYSAVNDRLRADGYSTLPYGAFTRLVRATGFPRRQVPNAEGFRLWRAFEHLALIET
ncbi:hypothetical protein [Streptomyces sp. A30]|uniref:hypothetical protein n=1 Tax=Streptomyces sp. A30 TaxID=2789273 RepID=UPI00397EEF7A